MHSPRLVTATATAIELALGADLPGDDASLRDAIRRLCADARRLGVRPEELIVLFKMTWRSHPELRGPGPMNSRSVLEHIVTMCIQEYYGNGIPR
jgi:hypothetical protein